MLARPSIPNPRSPGPTSSSASIRRRNRPSRDWPICAPASTGWRRLSTAELDRLLTETLDACSHRLGRLGNGGRECDPAAQRSPRKWQGVHLGGFGWVEEVRPAARRQRRSPATGTARTVRLARPAPRAGLRRRRRCRVPVQPRAGQWRLHPRSFAGAGFGGRGTAQRLHDAQGHHRRRLALHRSFLGARAQGAVPAGRRAAGTKPECAAGLSLRRPDCTICNLDKYAQPFRDRFPGRRQQAHAIQRSQRIGRRLERRRWRGAAWRMGRRPASAREEIGEPNLPPAGADQNAGHRTAARRWTIMPTRSAIFRSRRQSSRSCAATLAAPERLLDAISQGTASAHSRRSRHAAWRHRSHPSHGAVVRRQSSGERGVERRHACVRAPPPSRGSTHG